MSNATRNRRPRSRRARDPFAALPHWIAGDPSISPLCKTVLLALLFFAKNKDDCFPSDAAIGERVGRSEATVQRSLRQLQDRGLIDRRKGDANRTNRSILLTWRSLDFEGPPQSILRGLPPSGLRDKGDVTVQGERLKENSDRPPERQRPEWPAPVSPPAPARSPVAARTGPLATPVPARHLIGALALALGPRGDRIAQKPSQEPPSRLAAPEPARAPAAPAAVHRPADRPTVVSRPSPPAVGLPERPGSPTGPASRPILPPPAPLVVPAPPSPAGKPASLAGLTPQEQARLRELPEASRQQVLRWIALGDPICLGEARRLLAPPRPPEPPPQALATEELLLDLPGRPDRVASAAGRLSSELRDPGSLRFYEAAAAAVCRREHPATALLNSWRQGVSPQAKRPGAVFSTVWKWETRASG